MWDIFATLMCALFGQCDNNSCRVISHAKVNHIVCSYAVADIDTRLFLRNSEGEFYGGIDQLTKELSTNDPALMVMNGGMYHHDLDAVGLYVEGGKQTNPISTKGGWGNFHLLPNGVFWAKNGKLGVSETGAFIKAKIEPDYATQSGPMLVIDGKLHPRFLKDSDSRKIRNGVGVSEDGSTVYFALSKQAVTFWDFGKLFQTELKTPNALFLDGSVSAIRSPEMGYGGWRELGPMIAVFPKLKTSEQKDKTD